MYNFKRDSKLYLVELNNPADTYKHRIDVYADITMSQTFNEQSFRSKTLHSPQALHENALITRANPANFSFTTPIFDYSTITNPIIFSLGTGVTTAGNLDYFDLYLETSTELFRLEKCVIEGITFNLSRNELITMTVSGTAKKLSRGIASVPGTLVTDTQEYTSIKKMDIQINTNVLSSIASINIEFRNNIDWVDYSTLNNTLKGDINYPNNYVLKDRIVSGSITEFLTSDNASSLADNAINEPIDIEIYSGITQTPPLLEFNLPSTVYTRRLSVGDFYTRVYDFRLNYNTSITKPKYKGV